MDNLTFYGIEKCYTPAEIETVMSEVRKNFRFCYKRGVKYFNVPMALSQNFYSFTDDDRNKISCMYAWAFSIYGVPIIGRTYEELYTLLQRLIDILKLDEKKKIVIYVYDLYITFQSIRKHFNFKNVFATSQRHAIIAETDCGIEFRCAEALSGYPKYDLYKAVTEYKLPLMHTLIDERKARTAGTPLDTTEKCILISDVQTVAGFVAQRIEADGGVSKIPMTKTGYIREMCRNHCFYPNGVPVRGSIKRKLYKSYIDSMQLTVDSYNQLHRACAGGFTNCNEFYNSEIVENVTSFDITSAYIAVMCSEMFPTSSPQEVTVETEEQFQYYMENYCCIFDCEIRNITATEIQESPLSSNRCWDKSYDDFWQDATHKVIHAGWIKTTITNVDYDILEAYYRWDSMEIANFRIFSKGYLPKDLLNVILNLYKRKTELKGVADAETEYTHLKEMLNSIFGMCIQNPVNTEYVYNDAEKEWEEPQKADVEIQIDEYNRSPSRFLYYPWGIWITAYCRRNLLLIIYNAGTDYVYSDTDCVKIRDAEKHIKYINYYNETQKDILEFVMKEYGWDSSRISPKNIYGEEKLLGALTIDEKYRQFKALGAKRYIYIKTSGEYGLTVSGVDKRTALPYLLQENGQLLLQNFNESVTIPPDFAGRQVYMFFDEEKKGTVTDYLGNAGTYCEQSGVSSDWSAYSFQSENLIDFVSGVLYL